RIECVHADQLDDVSILLLLDANLGLSTDCEHLTRSHILKQIAHENVRCCLDVRRTNTMNLFRTVDRLTRIWLNGKAEDVQMRISLCRRLFRGIPNNLF